MGVTSNNWFEIGLPRCCYIFKRVDRCSNPLPWDQHDTVNDNENETGGLLIRWIYLLNCMFCYCYRFVPSLSRQGAYHVSSVKVV